MGTPPGGATNPRRWLLPFGLCVILAGGLGAGAGLLAKSRRAAAQPDPREIQEALRATRTSAARGIQASIDRLHRGEIDQARAALEQALAEDPDNGYTLFLLALTQVRAEEDAQAVMGTLSRAHSATRWDLYTDVTGLPSGSWLEREAGVIRSGADAACELIARSESNCPGLKLTREVGLRLARAEPLDTVHVQLGAYVRQRASESQVAVAQGGADATVLADYVAETQADARWSSEIDAALVTLAGSFPAPEEMTREAWVERMRAERQACVSLLERAPN